jgi:hypothetical protein
MHRFGTLHVPGGHGIGRGLRAHIRSSGTGGACGSRVAARGGSRSGGILDLDGQRLRPPRSIVGTRGVHFRPGQPVRGLAGVQWDTARSGLDGRRNPGRTVRRQTGLRADGGFAQGRRAQDWADSLEDREDPGGAGSLRRSAARGPPVVSAPIQHGLSEMNVGFGSTRVGLRSWYERTPRRYLYASVTVIGSGSTRGTFSR